MTTKHPTSNELADIYEALFLVLDNIPDDSHPGWRFAVESALFGGEGLASSATSFGEQQSNRNDFRIRDYRDEFGDGERVTEFPTIRTSKPRQYDRKYIDKGVPLPVAPDTNEVLPLFVDEEGYSEAISLLDEFPAEPNAVQPGSGSSQLLAPAKFPIVEQELSESNESSEESTYPDNSGAPQISPDDLADVYDGLYTLFKHLPDDVHPIWEEAIETVLFGGEYLNSETVSYGEQQASSNDFKMSEYREVFGNGDRVTEFPTIEAGHVRSQDQRIIDSEIKIPLSPDSGQALPLDPLQNELGEALGLLEEFPAIPNEKLSPSEKSSIIYLDGLLKMAGIEPRPESASETPKSVPANDSAESSTAETPVGDNQKKVLREEGAGEAVATEDDEYEQGPEDTKYDDPRAERAHQAAQKRDPSSVVDLGEEIKLVVKEADYRYTEPTIRGTKNTLVIFVKDAPQGLSEHDVIRAKVVDYGGNNNSAEAVFTGYA